MIGILPAMIAVFVAVSPVAEEFAERDAWVAAKFQGQCQNPPADPGLVVFANHNPLQKNAHDGNPMRVKDTVFARGLHAHAYSKIVVRLPSPGDTFTATVGVDSNHMTSGGRGSVVFSVSAGGDPVFETGVLREGMEAVAVSADVKGATEFVLEVADAGDGIACDQANWADAKVRLADGSEMWLDEMKVIEGQRPGYDAKDFFSFVYGGRSSSACCSTWPGEHGSNDLDAARTQYVRTWRDPATGLEVRCVGVVWKDYPTVEWTMYFKNGGSADTPMLESIRALDTVFARGTQGEFLLHHHIGDRCSVDSFAPVQTVLAPDSTHAFAPDGGRSTNGAWPYYNLERPSENDGVIVAIAWPGQWSAEFTRDSNTGLRVAGGQETTHFVLHPGEEIRTPLIVLQFYKGDWIRAQNIWRRWMLEDNFPKDHGKPLAPKLGAASVQFYQFKCTQAGDIEFIDRYAQEGIQLSYWWMDAGWYVNDGAGWPKVGTWEVDKARFPDGLKAISDRCHANNMELLVWFEVERVSPGTWLADNHPEWIHGGAKGGLLRMDSPDAVRWITGHVDKMIADEGIDLYRSDYNIDPLGAWKANDTGDRQGMTENQYVQGYLAYWDALRERHPGMLIDSCASGGRRNDLETMRRSVPLLRTDFETSPEGNQCATYGFDLWLPYHDSVNWENVPYNFRSNIAPFLQLNWDVRKKDFNYDQGRKFLSQWRSVVDYYFGDFYPLGEYSTSDGVWLAWQFDRPERSAGVVQAFRRKACPYVAAQYRLRALEPEATYIVTDVDRDPPKTVTGRELMEQGVAIAIAEQPGAALVTYRKMEP